MVRIKRSEEEREKRRLDIMSAAKSVFFSKSIQAATMDEIAETVGLSKGTLYLYFQSKEELYLSLLSEGTEIFLNMMENSITSDMNTETKLRKTADIYYKFFVEYNQYFKIMFLLQNGEFSPEKVSGELHNSSMKQSKTILKFLENIFLTGMNSGEFKSIDPWKMALFTWALSTGIFSILSEKDHRTFYGNLEIKDMLDFTIDRIIEILKGS